jgi:hypothetical protein
MSFPLGKMKGLTFMQYNDYSNAINIFRTVEAFNSNVSTMRSAGNTGLSYYTFKSSTEETNYTRGLYLLFQNDPINAALYTPVQKN